MLIVKSTFMARSAADSEPKEVVVDSTCPIRTVRVSDLDPWTGRVGVGWGSFTPNK
jgi:hypothetical protein